MKSNEIWKDIVGYEGLYQVSNYGKVKSFNYLGHGKIAILKPSTTNDGYLRVVLCVNRVRKYMSVHRLVAETFIENVNNLPQVNHKDENPSNNYVYNLEWCTVKYNSNYGSRNEKLSFSKMNKCSKSVIQYDRDGNFINQYPSIREAERSGFRSGHIIDCCKGKTKHHKGYIWRYTND